MSTVYRRFDGTIWLGPSFATDLITDVEQRTPRKTTLASIPETPPLPPPSRPRPIGIPSRQLGVPDILADRIGGSEYIHYLEQDVSNLIPNDFIVFEPAKNRGNFLIGRIKRVPNTGQGDRVREILRLN